MKGEGKKSRPWYLFMGLGVIIYPGRRKSGDCLGRGFFRLICLVTENQKDQVVNPLAITQKV
jgi:hypothetical protein